MSTAREKILQTASELMEKQGYHGTGLNEIIQKSGAPKGSLYYYFPEGKEQLASEAILRAGQIVSERFRKKTEGEPDPAKAIHDFLYMIAKRMEETKFYTGSTMTMIAMETVAESKRINKACQDAFDLILSAFREKFLASGFSEVLAAELALYVTTVVEGGILMSRVYHRTEPLRVAARHLQAYLASV